MPSKRGGDFHLALPWLLTGYTPLHMAVGYSHTEAVKVLLEHGASPDACDRQGRSVGGLVDYIRSTMPLERSTIGRRLALEEVAALLAGEPGCLTRHYRLSQTGCWLPGQGGCKRPVPDLVAALWTQADAGLAVWHHA